MVQAIDHENGGGDNGNDLEYPHDGLEDKSNEHPHEIDLVAVVLPLFQEILRPLVVQPVQDEVIFLLAVLHREYVQDEVTYDHGLLVFRY